jgi:hypothetical protein
MEDNAAPKRGQTQRRPPRKTKAEREQEARYRFYVRIAEIIALSFNNLVRWGCLLGIAYFGYRMASSLAGQTTMADIGLKFLTDMKLSDTFATLFGGGGVLFGLRRWQLQRKNTAHLAPRIAEHEKRLDPKRSSSRLLETGDTRPEDEP